MALRRKKIFQKTSYAIVWLVFSFLLWSCSENNKEGASDDVSLKWEDHKAAAIRVPYTVLKGISFDSARRSVNVRVENTDTDIIGEYSSADGALIFRPAIPLTNGLSYIVYAAGIPLARFSIPYANRDSASSVMAVYPAGNHVPENLLKIYIQFSRPMQQGQASENILMIWNERDTIPVFLDLQLELWNMDGTSLTLWLDPGRIKRGLQPNEKAGPPLEVGQNYELVIRKKWRDINGLELDSGYRQSFTVFARDSISPSIDNWEMEIPTLESKTPVKIRFNEILDYLLLKSTIHITNGNGTYIPGKIEVLEYGSEIYFYPDHPWVKGNYTLEVEARLEDLAGNNLNRLFDRDITDKKQVGTKEVHTRTFSIP